MSFQYNLALKEFDSVFSYAEGLSPLKALSSSLKIVKQLLPELLEQLEATASLLHQRERLRQINYLLVAEALGSKVKPEGWSVEGGDITSIFRNILTWGDEAVAIGFDGIKDLINGKDGKSLKPDDFSIQALGSNRGLPLKTYTNPGSTSPSSPAVLAKIWPTFPLGNEASLNQSLQTILAPWLPLGDYSQKDLYYAPRSYQNAPIDGTKSLAGGVAAASGASGSSQQNSRATHQDSKIKAYESQQGLSYSRSPVLSNVLGTTFEGVLSLKREEIINPNLPQIIPSDGPTVLLRSILEQVPRLRERVSRLFLSEGLISKEIEVKTAPVVKELIVSAKLVLVGKVQLLEQRRELTNLLSNYKKVRGIVSSSVFRESLLYIFGFKWL